jgi:hypothetical protein
MKSDIKSGLDFRQFSFHHIVRALRSVGVHYLYALSASLKCCFPPCLSAQGYSDDPRIFLLIQAPCGSDTIARDTAHHFPLQKLEPVNLPFNQAAAPFVGERRPNCIVVPAQTDSDVP